MTNETQSQYSQDTSDLATVLRAGKEVVHETNQFLIGKPRLPPGMGDTLWDLKESLSRLLESESSATEIRATTDQLREALLLASRRAEGAYSDSGGGMSAPPSPPPSDDWGERPTDPHGFWHQARWFSAWCLRRLRDHETPEMRHRYARYGIYASRVYAWFVLVLPPIVGWINLPEGAKLWFVSLWCTWSSLVYLWIQAKSIVIQDVIRPEHTNKDVINSFLPAAAVIVDIVVYVSLRAVGVELGYGLGWLILVTAVAVAVYDLKINNRIAIKLAAIPVLREREERGGGVL